MKKVILSFLTAITAVTAGFAQPVLDSADLCPIPKEVFIGHMPAITLGILPGASGPSATWNFSTLTDDSQDSTVFLACAATPYCSSFAPSGANIASYSDGIFGTGYYYYIADTNRLTLIGGDVPPVTVLADNGQDINFYSLRYLATHLDTTSGAVLGYYHYQQDSSTVDGYGNLTLPTGSYTNVLRVLTTSMVVDSTTGSAPDTTYTQGYNWYAAGFHNALLNITIDTSNGNTVEYYTKGTYNDPSLRSTIVIQPHTLQIFPDPATNEINIRFTLQNAADVAIAITDVTGRVAGSIPTSQMKQGTNDISFPTSGLPDGMYIVRLTSATESIAQKIVVAKR